MAKNSGSGELPGGQKGIITIHTYTGVGANKMLKEIYLELLDRCLLHCKHCSTSAHSEGSRLLSLETVRRIIDEGKALGAKRLNLSGGEPLLYAGIWDVLDYARAAGMETTLYTSGVVEGPEGPRAIDRALSRRLGKLAARVIVSLHGSDAATHDYITGVAGSFRLALASIKRLTAYNAVEAHMAVMKTNCRAVGDVLALCSGLGVSRVSLLRLVFQGRCLEHPQLVPEREDYLRFKAEVDALADKGYALRRGAPFRCLFFGAAGACSAGKDKVLVGPDGAVFPCEAFKSCTSDSNVNTMSLRRIWQSDVRLLLLRREQTAVAACTGCQYFSHCQGGCPGQRMIAHGDMFSRPDPACLLQQRAQ